MELGVCLVKPATWIQTRCSSVASAGLCVCVGGGFLMNPVDSVLSYSRLCFSFEFHAPCLFFLFYSR